MGVGTGIGAETDLPLLTLRAASQSSPKRSVVIGRAAYIEINFSTLTHSNQIFRNDIVFSHYHPVKFHLELLSAKKIRLVVFATFLLLKHYYILYDSTRI